MQIPEEYDTLTGKESQLMCYSIGHSTRSLDEFCTLLRVFNVDLIADVRSVPRSRHNSQFNKESLPDKLKAEGVRYVHMPELGGLRRPIFGSINLSWENRSFRGYADYMQTKEFSENLLSLVALIQENCVAVMCAEAVPWRCHRSLLADALVARHIEVKHILTETSAINHDMTPFANIEGTRISYPLFAKEKPQRTLTDFRIES
jgi:uncharacterized protein (DUF488 family)